MDYADIEQARSRPGLRLALSAGGPGPWSQAAKFAFQIKRIQYIPVAQIVGDANDELFAWTGHRNAPVAVFEDEAARTGWHEIVLLAERLAPEPALLPADSASRAEVLGVVAELASEGGLAWTRRLQMIDAMYRSGRGGRTEALADVLAGRYGFRGYGTGGAEGAAVRCADILAMLAARLAAQAARGSAYLVGDTFSAADLYWACMSQLIQPLPHELNPMPAPTRAAYERQHPLVAAAIEPNLIAHRDRIYRDHLSLPLDF